MTSKQVVYNVHPVKSIPLATAAMLATNYHSTLDAALSVARARSIAAQVSRCVAQSFTLDGSFAGYTVYAMGGLWTDNPYYVVTCGQVDLVMMPFYDNDADYDATADTNTYPRDTVTYTGDESARANSIPDIFAEAPNEVTATYTDGAIRVVINEGLDAAALKALCKNLERVPRVRGAGSDVTATVDRTRYTAVAVFLNPTAKMQHALQVKEAARRMAIAFLEELHSTPESNQMSLF